jgi:hypothetical protein
LQKLSCSIRVSLAGSRNSNSSSRETFHDEWRFMRGDDKKSNNFLKGETALQFGFLLLE